MISHPIPFDKTLRQMRIPCQPCVALKGGAQLKKGELWQYLPKQTRERRDSGEERTRQLSFANKASLNSSISRKLKTLAFFGIVIYFQKIQLIFRLSSHQNLVKIIWILLQREIGILKHDIEYDDIDFKTDLSRTCMPAEDKKCVDQLRFFCRIRSTNEVKISHFLLPKFSGRPKYLPVPPSLVIHISLSSLCLDKIEAFWQQT